MKAGYTISKFDLPQFYNLLNNKEDITLDGIFEIICDYYGVKRIEVTRKTRKREIVVIRHLYYWFAWVYTSKPLKRIGELTNGVHYSTVIHGRNTINDLTEYSNQTEKDWKELCNRFTAFRKIRNQYTNDYAYIG
jgi:chromosomal replication initiator protein